MSEEKTGVTETQKKKRNYTVHLGSKLWVEVTPAYRDDMVCISIYFANPVEPLEQFYAWEDEVDEILDAIKQNYQYYESLHKQRKKEQR